MLKAENKKMLYIYLAATAILSLLVGIIPTGIMFAHASNDNNNDRNHDSPQNKACYNSGFADGRQNNPYSKTMFSQCGVNGRAYYEGFLSGCISGQGKDFFSCQKLTGASFGGGGGGSSNSDDGGSGSGSGSNTNSGSGGGGGGGRSGHGGGGGGGFGPFGGGGSGGK